MERNCPLYVEFHAIPLKSLKATDPLINLYETPLFNKNPLHKCRAVRSYQNRVNLRPHWVLGSLIATPNHVCVGFSSVKPLSHWVEAWHCRAQCSIYGISKNAKTVRLPQSKTINPTN